MLTVLTAPTTNDLTVTTTAQRELHLETQEDLDGLGELIAQASAACAAWCNRPEGFGRATLRQTERLEHPREAIRLDRDILPAIASVTEGAETLTAADYELDGALLYRLSGDDRICWPAKKIVINYAAGYTPMTDVPHELERACLLVLAEMHAARGLSPGIRSENDGLTATTRFPMPHGIPPQAEGLLAPFRRWTIG